MKKQIAIAAVIVLLISSCKNEGGKIVKVPKSDTTSTLGVFLGYGLRSVHWGVSTKIEKDSLMMVWADKDSTTQTKKWSKYVIYAAEVPIKLDSALAAALKEPLLDSLGNTRVVKRIICIEPKYFRDGVTNLDSSVNELKKYLIIDSTNKK